MPLREALLRAVEDGQAVGGDDLLRSTAAPSPGGANADKHETANGLAPWVMLLQ
jgi:hypothetical protein